MYNCWGALLHACYTFSPYHHCCMSHYKKVKEWYRTPDYKLKCNTIVPCNDHCKCCLIKISRIHIHLKISRNARCNKIQIYEIIPTQRVNFFKSSIFLSAWILYTSCKKNGTRVLNNFQVKKVRNAL